MSKSRRWSDDQLKVAVHDSNSIRQVLSKLGLKEAGGNYKYVPQRIKELGLDTSHLLGQACNKGKNFGPKRPIEDYLSNRFPIHSHALKLRLIKEGILEHKCYNCQLVEWQGKPIPLELEHKNGKHSDNTLENLTLLCPNCHAQTPSYRGKNIKVAERRVELPNN